MLRVLLHNSPDAMVAVAMCVTKSVSFSLEPLPCDEWWLRLKEENEYLAHCIINATESTPGDLMEFEMQPILFP